MGRRLFQEVYASQDRTDALGLPDLMVVSEADDPETADSIYHAVHKTYFSKEKQICPYCQGANTAETKIRSRKFKDILPSANGNRKVIDLIFHQRYFRCDDCNRIFSENIDFAEDGCRYTNRLSDLLAEGTLTETYERVCKRYGVPASKTSVGVIMRRRLRLKAEQLPPLETPEVMTIFVPYFYNNAYPVVLGINGNSVRLIDVLSESSQSAYAVFFSTLDRTKVKQVFIDPDEQLHAAAATAFPGASIMVSEECVMRYIREGLADVIKKEGTRCFVYQRYHTLCKDEKYLNAPERRQVNRTLSRRHRLAGAYRAYQDLLVRMGSRWTIPIITGWIDDLPQYLDDAADEGEQLEELLEFDIINDITQLYERQINDYLALENKPSSAMASAVMGILDSLEEMPYCIYDVLHARMMLNVEHDWKLRDGQKYRTGVPVERLTEKMNEITDKIKSKKENEDNGY